MRASRSGFIRSSLVRLGGCALAVLAAGCASIGNLQRAETLGKGNSEIGLEPGAVVGGAGLGSGTLVPHVDVAIRYGLSERVDVGARFGSSGIDLQGKFLLSPAGDPRFAVSLAPTLGGVFFPPTFGQLNLALPVLVGFKTRGGDELVLGPRLQDTTQFFITQGPSGSAGTTFRSTLGLGGSLGYWLEISDGVALMPEVACSFPVFRTDPSAGSLQVTPELQAKLGIIVLQPRPIARAPPVNPFEAVGSPASPSAPGPEGEAKVAASEPEGQRQPPASSGQESAARSEPSPGKLLPAGSEVPLPDVRGFSPPPGTRVVRKGNDALLWTGVASFGAGYLTSAVTGLVQTVPYIVSSSTGLGLIGAISALIPELNSIWLWGLVGNTKTANPALVAGAVVLTAAQAVGPVLVLVEVLTRKRVLHYDREGPEPVVHLGLVPGAPGAPGGLTVVGTY